VAVAQFLLTILEQTGERPVYVAEAEQAEVVGMNSDLLDRDFFCATGGETPSGQAASRRRYGIA